MSEEDPPPLSPSTTSTVAVVAFSIALLALAGSLVNYRLTQQVINMVETVENRDARVNADQARAIKELQPGVAKVEGIEARITALEAAAAAAPAAEAEAAPE